MASECEITLSEMIQAAADALRPHAHHPQHVSGEEMTELLLALDEMAAGARRLETRVWELTLELADEEDLLAPEAIPVPDNVIAFPGPRH